MKACNGSLYCVSNKYAKEGYTYFKASLHYVMLALFLIPGAQKMGEAIGPRIGYILMTIGPGWSISQWCSTQKHDYQKWAYLPKTAYNLIILYTNWPNLLLSVGLSYWTLNAKTRSLNLGTDTSILLQKSNHCSAYMQDTWLASVVLTLLAHFDILYTFCPLWVCI